MIVFYASPASSIEEHQAAFDYINFKLETAGWPPAVSGLDKNCRSGVQSFHLPCTNRSHPGWAFFEVHNTKTAEIHKYGLVPYAIPVASDCQLVTEPDGPQYGDVPQHFIDKATATVRSMRSGRHLEFFKAGIKLSKLRHEGKRLDADTIRQILLDIAGNEQHMRKKVPDVMKSLAKYGRI